MSNTIQADHSVINAASLDGKHSFNAKVTFAKTKRYLLYFIEQISSDGDRSLDHIAHVIGHTPLSRPWHCYEVWSP